MGSRMINVSFEVAEDWVDSPGEGDDQRIADFVREVAVAEREKMDNPSPLPADYADSAE